ncbi:Transcriptional regulator [Rubellimicrobium thermophilum DSM 16684]|uniref:Transcriptional regulator n=1 Tax=Rubellimicrobium thermophilum DSM 16684 TaxID=1123069 RepID=S9R710_9RHOB|nr:sugar-binding transcriptional regulator [Rubellimicrobium thermophilum]EPX87778.1 Transcriptional regulator [Rubellimicrobium thermophilum DSM 16684]
MPSPIETDPEISLAVRAAWLHFVGGLTQAAVAKRLGLPSVKAHRLIARAVDAGLVKVSVDGPMVECVILEDALCRRFGLDQAVVAPDLGEEGLPLRALGVAGANFLRREIEHGGHGTIGLGHGRTLAAAIDAMPRFNAGSVRFVSLLGGLTRHYAANPHDVMHSLAAKTGAQAFVLPVPFFANSAEDRMVLLAQPGVQEIFDMSRSAALKVVGIGTADESAQLVSSGMILPAEIAEITRAGGVGEMLGNFFDARGRVLVTALSARLLAVGPDSSRSARTVAIAGGKGKVAAIRAVLESAWLTGLITDEATARALLA